MIWILPSEGIPASRTMAAAVLRRTGVMVLAHLAGERPTATWAVGFGVGAAAPVAWTTRIAAQVTGKSLVVIRDRIAAARVAHFDETGLRVAGKLAWMHSASTPTDVLSNVRAHRRTKGKDAAGVLPGFTASRCMTRGHRTTRTRTPSHRLADRRRSQSRQRQQARRRPAAGASALGEGA